MFTARSGSPRRLSAMLAAVLVVAASPAAWANVTPASYEGVLAPGGSVEVVKTVDVPAAPTQADVFFLADTTGSMGATLSNMKVNMAAIIADLRGQITDVWFGAGDYKDFPSTRSPYAFRKGAGIGPSDGLGGNFDAVEAIMFWGAASGGDLPEAQFFALDRLADSADPLGINWREGGMKVVVWVGDAPAHDSVCSSISGLGYDITEASVTQKLVDAGIVVVAIDARAVFSPGLNASPAGATNTDYVGCAQTGTAGQAQRIAAATGGVFFNNVAPNQVAAQIMASLDVLTYDVTANPVGCAPLQVSFAPASHNNVAGGGQVQFTETISLPASVTPAQLPPGGQINCSVDFLANGSSIGTQSISVQVPTATAKLRLVKSVDSQPDGVFDDDPSGWTFTVTGAGGPWTGTTNAAGVWEQDVDAGVVTITETVPGAGWATTYHCRDTATNQTIGTGAGAVLNGLVLTGGQTAVCLVANQRMVGRLNGGGHIADGVGRAAEKISFGGNLTLDATGSASGEWQTTFHNVSPAWLDGGIFHGSVFTAVAFTDSGGGLPFESAAFTVSGRLNGTDGWVLRVAAVDGVSDSILVELFDPALLMVYSSGWDFPAEEGARHRLDGGNLTSH